eukprot:141804-Pleurochrysis_carterae.AAC.1
MHQCARARRDDTCSGRRACTQEAKQREGHEEACTSARQVAAATRLEQTGVESACGKRRNK